MILAMEPLGDRAFLARFADAREAAAWARRVRSREIAGILDVTPAYRSVAVFADPGLLDLDELRALLMQIEVSMDPNSIGKLVVIPVLYDGVDLEDVAARLGLSVDEVVRIHGSRDYDVQAIGFQPGFPYAGDLAPALSGLPRLARPRSAVPAGSVAIVGRQTAIYPAPSPGGWMLIGRTPLHIVDVERGHFPIRVGDRLRFEPVSPAEFSNRAGESL